jgi:hypothetical protein
MPTLLQGSFRCCMAVFATTPVMSDRVSSKNSKANRIETGETSGGIRRNLFGGSRRKIAKKEGTIFDFWRTLNPVADPTQALASVIAALLVS